MIVSLTSSAAGSPSLGIPMIFPLTWEENVAANMKEIPFWELFPGLMVKDLYKAYRAGVDLGRIEPDQSAETIQYIAAATGKSVLIVTDFLKAMVVTVNQGKADPAILTAQERTGIEEKLPAATGAAVQAATKGATFTLGTLALVAVAGLVLYGAGVGLLPKPKFTTGKA